MQAVTPFNAPVVDELPVQVVVDSRYERFLPKATHAQVRIEHAGRIPGKLVYSNVGSRFTFGV